LGSESTFLLISSPWEELSSESSSEFLGFERNGRSLERSLKLLQKLCIQEAWICLG